MNAAVRWINGVLSLLLITMMVIGGGIFWFNFEVDRAGPLKTARLIKIASGQSSRKIAETLEMQGVISSRHVFLAYYLTKRIWARANGLRMKQLKAGEYEVKSRGSIRSLINDLTRGRSVLYSVTIPEGLTSFQILDRLAKNEALTGEIGEIPKEGFLMPETYLVPRNSARRRVLELMGQAQRKFLKVAWAARQESLPFKDVSEALVLASIVQRETGPNDDPARIASVFINRLRKGMRLQSDPTILYGKFGSKVKWGATIYRSDIARKTSHNTYQISGLPPTPICNPGKLAVNAVLNPTQTQDLYFVADGRGGHTFSRSNAEHLRAVAKWRRVEKQIKINKKRVKPANVKGNGVAGASPQVGLTAGGTVSPKVPIMVGAAPEHAQKRTSKQVREKPVSGATTMSTLGFPLPVRRPRRR